MHLIETYHTHDILTPLLLLEEALRGRSVEQDDEANEGGTAQEAPGQCAGVLAAPVHPGLVRIRA